MRKYAQRSGKQFFSVTICVTVKLNFIIRVTHNKCGDYGHWSWIMLILRKPEMKMCKRAQEMGKIKNILPKHFNCRHYIYFLVF